MPDAVATRSGQENEGGPRDSGASHWAASLSVVMKVEVTLPATMGWLEASRRRGCKLARAAAIVMMTRVADRVAFRGQVLRALARADLRAGGHHHGMVCHEDELEQQQKHERDDARAAAQ